MFGDVVEFRDKSYFDSHETGTLYLPGKAIPITFFACVSTDAFDSVVYHPDAQPAALAGIGTERKLCHCLSFLYIIVFFLKPERKDLRRPSPHIRGDIVPCGNEFHIESAKGAELGYILCGRFDIFRRGFVSEV